MNVLKPFLSPKKLRKLQNNPKAFFKDALDKRIIPIENQLKSLKPKKKHGFAEYYIISAVYNVEKYLDDYFSSILKQRLDFKNNIKIICVDDGSTDNSAKIIKNYQKRFPENIVYLHKENGGQASARNLGLQWLQEKLGYLEGSSAEITTPLQGGEADEAIHNPSYKPIWVTFTDPDDFLDRDYFYEVDKVLEENKSNNIKLVCTYSILYQESFKSYQDVHFAKNQFTEEVQLISISISTSISTSTRCFFYLDILAKERLLFDEDCRPVFEDAKFYLSYLLVTQEAKMALVKSAKFFNRKRSDATSTLDGARTKVDGVLKVSTIGCLEILERYKQKLGEVTPLVITNVLAEIYFQTKPFVNYPNNVVSNETIESYMEVLKKIFTFIDAQTILKQPYFYFDFKVGILNCFKNEYPPLQNAYIDGFDVKKEQILIKYFTPDDKDIESIRFDGKEVYADYEKIVQNDFLDRAFYYEKRLWVRIPKNAKKLEIFVRGQRAWIIFNKKGQDSLVVEYLRNHFERLRPNGNLWLFADRSNEADDNAERLYRYISKNYPEQNVIYALDKNCDDWDRLKRDKFNLVDFGGAEFSDILKNCDKFICSHLDADIMQHIHKRPYIDYVVLEHGETIANNCAAWFNGNPIKLLTASCGLEYRYIAANYTRYKIGYKEVKLTGFARYDSLLKGNKKNTKKILIMPTWRFYLRGSGSGRQRMESNKDVHKFLQSDYFKAWNSFWQDKRLKDLCEYHNYEIILIPHFQMRGYFGYFDMPKYINVINRDDGKSLQTFFKNVDLLITDYSSINFTMAYIQKPTIYYQFNEEKKLMGHHLAEKRFDYRKDGFGPVVTTEEDLLQELEVLLKNDCKVGEPYKSNIENTFEFRDGKCCERIYQAILELDKPYERKWTLDYVLNLAQNALNAKCYKEASERFRFVLEHLGELTTASLRGMSKTNDEAIHNQADFKDSISKSRVDKVNDGLSEEILFDYLLASRFNQTSKESLEFIKAKEYERKLALSNKTKFEIIKNYIEILDAKEVIARLEDLREAIPAQDLLEFAYLKLRTYAYLGDKSKLKEVYNELKNTYNIDKKDLDLDLFLFQNELIKATSVQATATSAGFPHNNIHSESLLH